MKLTKNSQILMSFFQNPIIHHPRQTKNTNNILIELYDDIINANKYLQYLKQTTNNNYYNIQIKKITNVSQVPKPNNFNANSFPEIVRKHIDQLSVYEISYTFSLFKRNITIIFIVEDEHVELKIENYNRYVDAMLLWLHILNDYASNSCSNKLIVYLYFTGLQKKLPKNNLDILDENNVNTAFTTTCPKDSEIVIFRHEEWFKVFIHETFHNFGLDFSDMNNIDCSKKILDYFPVKSQVNLYEAYSEFWAEIMNALFCSFFSLKNKSDKSEFLQNSVFFINFERNYSFFQLVKTLNFMGLQYKDLYSKSNESKILRDHLYKENTNVLSYYVIKTILINNYQYFLSWCKNNNFSLLQFKKTTNNLNNICEFIGKYYKSKSMLENVKSMEHFFNKIRNSKKKSIHHDKLILNMRMSICELG